MVNETILGGLRIAMVHKSSLKDAMQSFYNAGYSKEEVEEAAKIIYLEQNKQTTSVDVTKTVQTPTQTIVKKDEVKTQPQTVDKEEVKKVAEIKVQTPQAKEPVKVESVEKKLSKRKIQIILLVGGLIFLLIALIGLFMFKDKIF